MYLHEKRAWIDFASTLPEYRGRGAQSALTARRIEDCARLGGETMVVETAAATPEKGAPSLRNMQRMGFEVAYLRPNYLLELD
jgi:ribosomal protein S18 acetylase RimI-like enzyme